MLESIILLQHQSVVVPQQSQTGQQIRPIFLGSTRYLSFEQADAFKFTLNAYEANCRMLKRRGFYSLAEGLRVNYLKKENKQTRKKPEGNKHDQANSKFNLAKMLEKIQNLFNYVLQLLRCPQIKALFQILYILNTY